uniref:Uncharacterized protein n=1 Tax=Anguilla anguilla TaxID=7936 RepID=A0A0E9Q088_ANGAN
MFQLFGVGTPGCWSKCLGTYLLDLH